MSRIIQPSLMWPTRDPIALVRAGYRGQDESNQSDAVCRPRCIPVGYASCPASDIAEGHNISHCYFDIIYREWDPGQPGEPGGPPALPPRYCLEVEFVVCAVDPWKPHTPVQLKCNSEDSGAWPFPEADYPDGLNFGEWEQGKIKYSPPTQFEEGGVCEDWIHPEMFVPDIMEKGVVIYRFPDRFEVATYFEIYDKETKTWRPLGTYRFS